MSKIYVCTYETMMLDLLRNNHNEDMVDTIINTIISENCILQVTGTFITGAVTAAYLKIQYGINCTVYTLE